MKKFVMTAVATLLGLGMSATPQSSEGAVASQQRTRYGGTASCMMRCRDGTCRFENCSGSGYLSYEDARRALQLKLEAKVRSEAGRIEGEIGFKIEKEF
jgi:hypothetical protein